MNGTEVQTIDLLTFSLSGFFVGITSGTIGFTGWTIVLPFLWIGLKYTLYQAMFVSVCMDAVSGITLAIIYALHDRIHWKMGFIHGGIGCVAALISTFFAVTLLDYIEDMLRNATGFFVIVVGIVFIVRGIGTHCKEMKEKRDIETYNSVSSEDPLKTKNNFDDSIESLDSLHLSDNQIHFDDFSANSLRRISIPRHILSGIAGIISGMMAGILGIGSGMNYVLIFMVFGNIEMKKATATGSMIMGMLMLTVGTMYVIILPIYPILWQYIVAGCISTLVGSLIGGLLLIKVPKQAVNWIVGVLLIAVGTFATAQAFSLKPIVIINDTITNSLSWQS